MNDAPLVSVCLITYNHAPYFRQAIESILMQEVDFAIEIIIADDFSTDGTREVTIEYQKKYPQLIRLILQEKNLGAALNWAALMNAPIGKYIAYLDGDDYWTDPLKLQKQVDFLEKNQEYILCAHVVSIVSSVEMVEYMYDQALDSTDSRRQALGHYIPTVSVLFKNFNSAVVFPEWLLQCPFGDWALFVYLGQFGKIKILNENMATYRFTRSGIFSALANSQITRNMILTTNILIKNISDKTTVTNLCKNLAGQNIKLLSLHHHHESKKLRWKVLWEIKPWNMNYTLSQYRYILVYLIDLFVDRRKMRKGTADTQTQINS